MWRGKEAATGQVSVLLTGRFVELWQEVESGDELSRAKTREQETRTKTIAVAEAEAEAEAETEPAAEVEALFSSFWCDLAFVCCCCCRWWVKVVEDMDMQSAADNWQCENDVD